MIATEENSFRAAIAAGRRHAAIGFTQEVRDDMTWLYEKRLNDSVAGKTIRGRLLAQAESRCPLCNIGIVKTLEHSFPKSEFPRLAVDPMNLIPSCRDCNFERGVGAKDGGMNPYADIWAFDHNWLGAEIISPDAPFLLKFSPIWHPDISPAQLERLRQHFDDCGLAERYALRSVDEFELFRNQLVRHLSGRPGVSVFEILYERLRTLVEVRGVNYWQTAAYAEWLVCCDAIDWLGS
ncbi:hypothetical protein AAEP80_16015 [Curtobacterium sp. L3-7]|uniref:hypothetical protein n=1 Tax=Curtobacterium sp. L3-7 TaxID=3138787 RepID=UPI003B51CE15